MLFRRRKPQDTFTRFRNTVWPSAGFGRSARYFRKRVMRLSGSPHAIALGVAVGVAVSFTPFFGVHALMSVAVAFLLGGSLVASALATAIANPLTMPFIWAATYKVGRLIVGGPRFRVGGDIPVNLAEKSLHLIWPVIKPMLVGAVPLGLAAGAIAYVAVVLATNAFRKLRRERLAARRRARDAASGTPTMMESA